MSEPAFPPNVSAALDRLTVPPLPQGFGNRLIARIEAGDLPHVATDVAQHLSSPRRRFGGSGWRRSGGIVAIAATFSLATATAAASGFFGEPIYVPVVSDALAKADLVELPKREQIAPKPAAKGTSEQAAPAMAELLGAIKKRGVLLKDGRLTHSYPHCWRSKTPIIFRAVDQWFVSLDKAGHRQIERRAQHLHGRAHELHALRAGGSKPLAQFCEDGHQRIANGLLDGQHHIAGKQQRDVLAIAGEGRCRRQSGGQQRRPAGQPPQRSLQAVSRRRQSTARKFRAHSSSNRPC